MEFQGCDIVKFCADHLGYSVSFQNTITTHPDILWIDDRYVLCIKYNISWVILSLPRIRLKMH